MGGEGEEGAEGENGRGLGLEWRVGAAAGGGVTGRMSKEIVCGSLLRKMLPVQSSVAEKVKPEP